MSLKSGDWGSVLATVLATVGGLAAIPALSGDFAIYFGPDGTPNTVAPTVIGVFILPVVASGMFLYLRTGTLLGSSSNRASDLSAFLIVTGTASFQASLLLLNLDILSNPLLAVAPGIVLVLLGGASRR